MSNKVSTKLSDKQVLRLLQNTGPKTAVELYHTLKDYFPHIDKSNLLRRLRRLRKKSKIGVTKDGKFFCQTSTQKKEKMDDLPENDFYAIVEKYKYKPAFSKKQLLEANFVKNIPFNTQDRTDFRDDLVITIDGEDAKDLDDAVSLIKTDKGYQLTVHIADVSHYVKEDSYLDREALKRGNSVYLIDKVIPMLPEALSNQICSLNTGVERLSMSVVIQFDLSGNVLDFSFHEGIINVKKRYSYNEVEEVLQGRVRDEDQPFVKMLQEMKELSQNLYQQRIQNGTLDFDFDEIKFIVDENSNPIEVKRVKTLSSHKIIEEFMLIANQTVARFLGDKGESIYRIHEPPAPDKIIEFNRFIQKFGYRLNDPADPDPIQLQSILAQIANTKEEKLINIVLLRSMRQAYYTTDNKGHFGLSFKDYTHFTSPIRRYPDLIIHRLLKKAIGIKTECKLINSSRYLKKVSEKTSITERTAMEAEREIIKKKSARFMKDKIGEVFEWIVSGVTSFGMFVELLPYGIEGLVRLVDLKETYIYDEENYQLYRIDKKVIYQLGSPVKAILSKVDVKRNFIDLVLSDSE